MELSDSENAVEEEVLCYKIGIGIENV